MKSVIVLVIMLLMMIVVYGDFEMLTTFPHGAIMQQQGWFSIGKFDFNNNGIEELILHTIHYKLGDEFYPYHPFFEYRREGGYHFEEVYRIVRHGVLPIGIGDLDNDGLYELIEMTSISIYIMEQKSREEFPDTTKQVLWLADTTYSFGPLYITNELKGDSIDRLVWVGLPGITTRTRSYGWGYLEYIGENTLELTHTFADTVQLKNPISVGNINNNGLIDIIIATNFYASSKILWYEATDKTCDSFNFKDSIRFSVWNDNDPLLKKMIFTNDINRNGYNEILLANSWYMDGLTLYQYYRYYLIEYNPETDKLEIKWTTECSSPPNPNITIWANADLLSAGVGCDCGDVDGDGLEDILINGGRHVEVWKNYGGDIYGKIYEWTDSTYQTLSSTVRAYDFNGNGIKEVIFLGHDYWCPPPYPTEYTPDEYQRTYVFEYRRLQVDVDNNALLRDVDTLILGSSVNGDTLYKEIKFCNVGYDTIKLDSIVFESECYGVKGSFPELIWVGESAGKEIWFKGDSAGRYLDSAWIYGDSNRYKLMLKGAYRYKVEIDSIVASYVSIYDRNVVSIYFNEKTTMPEITKDNIDEVLRLSSGHSWKDKFGEIYNTKWIRYNGRDKLVVQLSAGGNRPTVSIGDSVYIDNGEIRDEWLKERVVTSGVIRGELYFSGIDEEEINRDGLNLTYKGGVLYYSVEEGKIFEIEVYDVMGRVIARRDEGKGRKGIIDMNRYGCGVYFVRMRKGEDVITKKIVKIK